MGRTTDCQELEADYVRTTEIARDADVTIHQVHNWIKYHRYLTAEKVLGVLVVRRSEYERFRKDHPELFSEKEGAANPTA